MQYAYAAIPPKQMSITAAPSCDKALRAYVGSPQIQNARKRLHASESRQVAEVQERGQITTLLQEKQHLLSSLASQVYEIQNVYYQLDAISRADAPLFMANKQYLSETIEMQEYVIKSQIEANEKRLLEQVKASLHCPPMSPSQGAAEELLQSQHVPTSELTRTQRELALSASQNSKQLIEFQAALVNNLKLASALTGTTLSTRSSLHGSKVFLSNDQIQQENEEMEQAIAELQAKKAAQDYKNEYLKQQIEAEKSRLADAQKYCDSMKQTINAFKKQLSGAAGAAATE